MRKLFAAFALCALTACVSPPPVESPSDVIGQGYASVAAVATTVGHAQDSGSINAAVAADVKSKLQDAKDLLDAAALFPPGSPEATEAVVQAQGILNLLRVYLTRQGVQP